MPSRKKLANAIARARLAERRCSELRTELHKANVAAITAQNSERNRIEGAIVALVDAIHEVMRDQDGSLATITYDKYGSDQTCELSEEETAALDIGARSGIMAALLYTQLPYTSATEPDPHEHAKRIVGGMVQHYVHTVIDGEDETPTATPSLQSVALQVRDIIEQHRLERGEY